MPPRRAWASHRSAGVFRPPSGDPACFFSRRFARKSRPRAAIAVSIRHRRPHVLRALRDGCGRGLLYLGDTRGSLWPKPRPRLNVALRPCIAGARGVRALVGLHTARQRPFRRWRRKSGLPILGVIEQAPARRGATRSVASADRDEGNCVGAYHIRSINPAWLAGHPVQQPVRRAAQEGWTQSVVRRGAQISGPDVRAARRRTRCTGAGLHALSAVGSRDPGRRGCTGPDRGLCGHDGADPCSGARRESACIERDRWHLPVPGHRW